MTFLLSLFGRLFGVRAMRIEVVVSGSVNHVLVLPPGMVPGVATKDDLAAMKGEVMGVLEDMATALEASFANMKARVQADIDALKAQIEEGVATPEILARLDTLRASMDQEDPIPNELTP